MVLIKRGNQQRTPLPSTAPMTTVRTFLIGIAVICVSACGRTSKPDLNAERVVIGVGMPESESHGLKWTRLRRSTEAASQIGQCSNVALRFPDGFEAAVESKMTIVEQHDGRVDYVSLLPLDKAGSYQQVVQQCFEWLEKHGVVDSREALIGPKKRLADYRQPWSVFAQCEARPPIQCGIEIRPTTMQDRWYAVVKLYHEDRFRRASLPTNSTDRTSPTPANALPTTGKVSVLPAR